MLGSRTTKELSLMLCKMDEVLSASMAGMKLAFTGNFPANS